MRRKHTRITVWPAISDLMTTLVVIAVLGGVVGYMIYVDDTDEVDPALTQLDSTRNHILNELRDQLKEYGMKNIEVLHNESVLRFSENAINFDLGSEVPIAEHELNVGKLARVLAEIVPCYIDPTTDDGTDQHRGVPASIQSYCYPPTSNSSCAKHEREWLWRLGTILIEGHTDSVQVTKREGRRFTNNLELSSMRAASVYRMISDCEPDIMEMRNKNNVPIFSTSGYGEMRPAIPEDPGHESNRRIDIRLLPERRN